MKKLFVLLSLLIVENLFAGEAIINWTPPTQREDGTPVSISEIAEYHIYYGKDQGDYQETKVVSGGGALGGTVSGLDSGGTWYFVVTAVDTEGRESLYSKEVVKELPLEKPRYPSNIKVFFALNKLLKKDEFLSYDFLERNKEEAIFAVRENDEELEFSSDEEVFEKIHMAYTEEITLETIIVF